MYITFVRPILEYASVVWDGCSQYDIDKLGKVQLNTARIVTGLPIIAYILKWDGKLFLIEG